MTNIDTKICNPVSSEYFSNLHMSFDPYPIPISQVGSQLSVTYGVDLLKPIEVGAKVGFEVTMDAGPAGPVKIPCVSIQFCFHSNISSLNLRSYAYGKIMNNFLLCFY
jgi:hypothetical protein